MKILRVTVALSIAALAWLMSTFLQPITPKPAPSSAGAAITAAKVQSGAVSDFDGQLLSASNGMRWLPTTDKYIGGTSTVTPSLVAGGAGGSAGAMRLAGTIALGTNWSWAGILLNPGDKPMVPVDARACRELVFHARGDGRELAVVLFSGSQMAAEPRGGECRLGRVWQELRGPVAGFPGPALAHFRAIAITAGLPPGAYQFDIDSVEIR